MRGEVFRRRYVLLCLILVDTLLFKNRLVSEEKYYELIRSHVTSFYSDEVAFEVIERLKGVLDEDIGNIVGEVDDILASYSRT